MPQSNPSPKIVPLWKAAKVQSCVTAAVLQKKSSQFLIISYFPRVSLYSAPNVSVIPLKVNAALFLKDTPVCFKVFMNVCMINERNTARQRYKKVLLLGCFGGCLISNSTQLIKPYLQHLSFSFEIKLELNPLKYGCHVTALCLYVKLTIALPVCVSQQS